MIRNWTLRIATRYVKMTLVGHIHTETKTLIVEDHLSLLSLPLHSSPHTHIVSQTLPALAISTLQSPLLHRTQPYLVDGIFPPNIDKETIHSLHFEAVEWTVASPQLLSRGLYPHRLL